MVRREWDRKLDSRDRVSVFALQKCFYASQKCFYASQKMNRRPRVYPMQSSSGDIVREPPGWYNFYTGLDSRPMRLQNANLYYSEITRGIRVVTHNMAWVAGRPFREPLVFSDAANFPEYNHWEWVTADPRMHRGESIAQILGDSHEIQYCAAAAGIPYDIVGLIELLILAIV